MEVPETDQQTVMSGFVLHPELGLSITPQVVMVCATIFFYE